MARTKFPDRSMLPDTLHPGQKLITKTGWVFSIHSRNGRDAYDMPTYRLRHPAGTTKDGFKMPVVTGDGYYSRDDLQAMGVRLHQTEQGGRRKCRRTRW